MAVVWEKDGEAFYAAIADADGLRFHLAVTFGDNRWNWNVWRPNQHGAIAQSGNAVTLHGAMWDAEKAAR